MWQAGVTWVMRRASVCVEKYVYREACHGGAETARSPGLQVEAERGAC